MTNCYECGKPDGLWACVWQRLRWRWERVVARFRKPKPFKPLTEAEIRALRDAQLDLESEILFGSGPHPFAAITGNGTRNPDHDYCYVQKIEWNTKLGSSETTQAPTP